MDELQLQPGEQVLLQLSGACRYCGDDEFEIDDLYLTNKSIVCVREESKGIFFTKTERHITRIPLTQILIIDSIPQVDQVKDKDHGKTLKIAYSSGSHDFFEFYDSPRKNYPIWKSAIANAVLQILPVEETEKKQPPKFCANCGAALYDGANFCSKCGSAVSANPDATSCRQEDNRKTKQVSKNTGENTNGPYKLRITEKRYSIRKNYIISDAQGNVRYIAKSEGLPKMPEIVVYRNDTPVGRIEREVFSKPIWGDPEYVLHWNGKKYASLYRQIKLKRCYEIPEKDWKFDFGVMTSKLYNKEGSVVMEFGMIISSGKDRYSAEYYDEAYEPAAVLFALVGAMNIDLEYRTETTSSSF